MVSDLPGLLADAGIGGIKSLRPGHSEKLICPRCAGGRTKEHSLYITIDEDGKGAVWKCYRSKCQWQANGRIDESRPMERGQRPMKRPADHSASVQIRPDALYEWFAARKIGARTVNELGIYAIAARNFPKAGKVASIVFPYRWRGELVNRKYRALSDVKDMAQETDAQHTLFNVDQLGEEPEEIIWVEGEPDVAALYECGIKHAVTLKDGAPAEAKFNDDDRRFGALRTHSEMLAKAKRIILAGDMDVPGLALREELARRLGRHRCFVVDWPAGCKDACDTLLEHGLDAVQEAVRAAEPYPIEGLNSAYSGKLGPLLASPPPPVMTTGTVATDDVLNLPADGRLIVVTGYPSSGKTAWVRFVMMHTVAEHDRKWLVFSPEMQPWEEFIVQCAEVLIGKPFWPSPYRDRMNVAEVAKAERWMTNKVIMMVNDALDKPPTLDWIFDHARTAVLRDGVTDLMIDPWNEIDHDRGMMSETDYIGRSLQRFKAFGQRYGCNVWMIAHPSKPPPTRPGEKRGPPGPYDISGSANWFNRADIGLTVHSPEAAVAQVIVWKARFRRWAKRGAQAVLEFDDICGRYSTPPKYVPKSGIPPANWEPWDDDP